MANDKEDDVDINKIYGIYVKCPKKNFAQSSK